MNFYTKVLSRFATGDGMKLTVTVDVAPTGGVPKSKLDETLRHARTCDYCGSVLSARERACDGCRPTVPGARVNKATKGAA